LQRVPSKRYFTKEQDNLIFDYVMKTLDYGDHTPGKYLWEKLKTAYKDVIFFSFFFLFFKKKLLVK